MKVPAPHPEEAARLRALRELELLDTGSEQLFDEIVQFAAQMFDVPTALVSLVDRDRQWFKAKIGLDGVCETGRDVSFCGHAILTEGIFEIPDATADDRFADNPLVSGEPGVRFYAAHPVRDRDSGLPLGTLCIIDRTPRLLSAQERQGLLHLAGLVEGIIATRRQVRSLTGRLFQEKQRIEVTLSSIADAVLTTDNEGFVEYLNPVAERLTGWRTVEAAGRRLEEVFVIVHELTREPAANPVARCLGDGSVHHMPEGTVLLSRSGEQFHIAESAAPIRDSAGAVFGAVLVFHDITEQRKLQQDLARQAQEDPLTGLPNRREFERRVLRAVDTARARDVDHALMYLDLDQFKLINDSCGHPAGDELLRQIARLFVGQLRQRDTVARLGGDEFGVLLENCPMPTARGLAEKLRTAVEEYRFVQDSQRFQVGLSIGLTSIAADCESASEALRAADSALYAAKEGGRNRVHVFRPHDEALARRHGEMRWVSRIQEAVENDRFVLMAQPILAMSEPVAPGRRIEVLLRLNDGDERLIAPSGFMPAAERYHQAVAIDRWVVEHTLRVLSDHPDALAAMEYCAINLSGQSLGDRMFHAFVSRMLEQHDVAPHRLCFEVTETAAIANMGDARRFMTTLNAQGCHFSLDDFGSGLSSFGYLRELPVRHVKIDARFVRDVADDPIDLAMVRSIAEVARLMGKSTVAEGIENAAVLAEIQRLGIDYGQGFELAAPAPLVGVLRDIARLAPIDRNAAGVRAG